jgi:AcrR family transcriptional regulator
MQERAIRTREALRRTAAEVFAREGFVRGSLPLISNTAGVSRGALHFHFHSKDDLAAAIEEEAAVRLDRILRRVRERRGITALQLLADAAHELMESVATDAVVRAGFRLNADVTWESGVDLWERWRAWVCSVLVEAESRGELAAGVSRSAACAVIVTMTAGLEALASRNPEWGSPETLDRCWSLLLPRLEAPRSSQPARS